MLVTKSNFEFYLIKRTNKVVVKVVTNKEKCITFDPGVYL